MQRAYDEYREVHIDSDETSREVGADDVSLKELLEQEWLSCQATDTEVAIEDSLS